MKRKRLKDHCNKMYLLKFSHMLNKILPLAGLKSKCKLRSSSTLFKALATYDQQSHPIYDIKSWFEVKAEIDRM